jgi:hypothetical protein
MTAIRLGFCALFSVFFFLYCSGNPPLEPEDTTQDQFIIFVGVSSNPKTVAPGERSVVSALLLDQNNRPVPGEEIRFSTDFGSLSALAVTTDDSGFSIVTFTAPVRSGTAAISATWNSVKHTTKVEVKNTSVESAQILPAESSLLANGESKTMVRSTWRNDEGDALKGIRIEFEVDQGSIISPVFTDSSGLAVTEYTSPARRTDIIARITASSDSVVSSAQILLKGVSFQVTASPSTLVADGRSISRIRVVLKESSSFVAIAGAGVTLATNLGTIPNEATTNASGVADIDLTSSQETGMATVTAIYGKTLTDTTRVTFGESVPTFLNLTANPTVIASDTHSTSRLQAVVTDAANNPVPDGTEVHFEIVDGSGTIESNKVTQQGVAASTLVSGSRPDTVTVVASAGALSDTIRVRFVVGQADQIVLASDSSSIRADGTTATRIVAEVIDPAGNPVVDGTMVNFTADIGDITASAQTIGGVAVAQFSSNETGIATISASVGIVSEQINVELRPGPPNSILLTFDPKTLGVKDSGRNQTVTVSARVIDSQNNAVLDGTLVRFSIFQAPGGNEFLSNTEPIPTLNGMAQVSLNSGIRSGTARIMAEVTDNLGTPSGVRAVSTEITVFAGPPFIEHIDFGNATSHLAVGVTPSNIRGWDRVNSTAEVTVVAGDKFNNPVPEGTAVYFTTTGGVISTYQGFTNNEGVATVTIHSGNPLPDITRFHNTEFVSLDPNRHRGDFTANPFISGIIPDFDLSEVQNSLLGFGENDGVARILAVTEGVDSTGQKARAWSVTSLVFSGAINTFIVTADRTTLLPGESARIDFTIYDINGNPIVGGSTIVLAVTSGDAQLSWNTLTTDDPGVTHFSVALTNNIDASDPDAKASSTPVTVIVESENGNVIRSSPVIDLLIN